VGCGNDVICLARARFHLPIAELGKTSLGEEERRVLAPNDMDGGPNLVNRNIRNPIFLYEESDLSEDYIWKELAKYLNVRKLNNTYHEESDPGMNIDAEGRLIKICDAEFDELRKSLMPIAHEMSVWLRKFFVPLSAQRGGRNDIVVPNPDRFSDIVRNYTHDPCGVLERVNTDGRYDYKSN